MGVARTLLYKALDRVLEYYSFKETPPCILHGTDEVARGWDLCSLQTIASRPRVNVSTPHCGL